MVPSFIDYVILVIFGSGKALSPSAYHVPTQLRSETEEHIETVQMNAVKIYPGSTPSNRFRIRHCLVYVDK